MWNPLKRSIINNRSVIFWMMKTNKSMCFNWSPDSHSSFGYLMFTICNSFCCTSHYSNFHYISLVHLFIIHVLLLSHYSEIAFPSSMLHQKQVLSTWPHSINFKIVHYFILIYDSFLNTLNTGHSMPHAYQCSRSTWIMPSVKCLNFCLAMQWSGRWTRWFLKFPFNRTVLNKTLFL